MNHKLEKKGGSQVQFMHLVVVAILFLVLGAYLGDRFLKEKVLKAVQGSKGAAEEL